jgi:hypothetical protein
MQNPKRPTVVLGKANRVATNRRRDAGRRRTPADHASGARNEVRGIAVRACRLKAAFAALAIIETP